MTNPPSLAPDQETSEDSARDFQEWAQEVIEQALAHLRKVRERRSLAVQDGAISPSLRRRRQIRAATQIVGFTLVAAVVTMIVSNLSAANNFIPATLVGIWTTADPRYEGAALELRRDSIIFHGPFGANAFKVSEVSRERDEHGLRYDVDYVTLDAVQTFSFYHHERPPSIRIRHLEKTEWRFAGKTFASLQERKAAQPRSPR